MYEAKCLVMDYQHPSNNTMHQQHLHQLHSFAPTAGTDASTRWTQYQQLWRQHMFINGKNCGKDSPEKKEENDLLWSNVEAQAAFLSPSLWDSKNLQYETDLKYCDLDEFLSENGIPLDNQANMINGNMIPGQHTKMETACISPCAVNQPQVNGVVLKREPSPTPSEPLSPLGINPPSPTDSTLSFASSSREFDPRSRHFSDEELKPQPMVKKSRKQFVPDGLKDEKYWARRRKNNMAAKRSRDARRLKENQIALRAGFLEKENMGLRQEVERLKRENLALRDRLSKFTEI